MEPTSARKLKFFERDGVARSFTQTDGGAVCNDYYVLRQATYRFMARPRIAQSDLHPEGTNCRTLIQDYFLDQKGVFFGREAIEYPGLWDHTGLFLPFEGSSDLAALPHESVVFAERIRDAAGKPIDRARSAFSTAGEYRLHLHMALILHSDIVDLDAFLGPDIPRKVDGDSRPVVLHATAVAGGICVWDLETFGHYYKGVAAKSLSEHLLYSN